MTKAEQLRERVARLMASFRPGRGVPNEHDQERAARILSTIVEEAGITENQVEVLRELHESRAHLDQIQGYMQHVLDAADALSHILEASK